MNLFSHLDLAAELRCIEALAMDGLHVAHHADADGSIASALITSVLSKPIKGYCQVASESLHLAPLVQWTHTNAVENLLTFDINVWSGAGALKLLAGAVGNAVRVVDDHLGEMTEVPRNVTLVELLPPGPRYERVDQIRPSFLFADSVVTLCGGKRKGMQVFLALSGLYGEGVSHLFSLPGLNVGPQVHGKAREFGRGLTALYIALGPEPGDDSIVRALIDLIDCGHGRENDVEAATRALDSEIGFQVLEASKSVSQLVKREVEGLFETTPWLSTETFDVHIVDVQSGKRIVNLVASEARTLLKSGVTLAVQEVPSGWALELRRAKNLDTPDLAEILMRIEGSMFLSRGGHPMAAGATVVSSGIDEVLNELRAEFYLEGNSK